MKTHLFKRIISTGFLGAFVLGTFGACGIKGDLKTPPPLWGDKTKTEQDKTEQKN